MCLLIFCTPGSNDIAKVAALVLDLRIVAHYVWRKIGGDQLDSLDRDIGCRVRIRVSGSNNFWIDVPVIVEQARRTAPQDIRLRSQKQQRNVNAVRYPFKDIDLDHVNGTRALVTCIMAVAMN
jgi:hypothetical protein